MSELENEGISRHEVYYLSEGTVFLVERCLFKIPRYNLERNSQIFQDMFNGFNLPPASGYTEGAHDANPIRLDKTLSIDFERLLAFLYPLTLDYKQLDQSWGLDQWSSILKLADKWEMQAARSFAVEKLDHLASGINKVTLGRKYDHPKWIWDGFMELCLRGEALTESEALQLNMKDILGCAKARESAIRRHMTSNPSWGGYGYNCRYDGLNSGAGLLDLKNMKNDLNFQSIIEKAFGISASGPVSGNQLE